MNQIRRASIAALVVYWIALFTGTHLPAASGIHLGSGDKLLHFLAYAGLAMLLTLAVGWHIKTQRRAWYLAIIVIGLCAFAGFDELTQPIVNRQADWFDWYADVAGVLVGTTVGAMVLRLLGSSGIGSDANGECGVGSGE